VSAPLPNLEDLGRERLLFLAPHPDDETLAAGALLHRATHCGADVCVVFATSGDNNPWVQRVSEHCLSIGPRQRAAYGQRRRREALEALAALGVADDRVQFLDYPDQGLTAALVDPRRDLINRCTDLINEFRPTLLVGPSMLDVHPDHNALALALRLALHRVSMTHRPRWEWSYLVHPPRHPPAGLSLRPGQPERDAKHAAALCHRSQRLCHRGAFAAAVRANERFLTETPSLGLVEGHPVRDATLGGTELWLDLLPQARWTVFGRPRLHLLSVDAGDGLRHMYVDVDWRRQRAPLRLAATHETLGHAVVDRRRHGGFVKLPLAPLRPATQLFVKLERRIGFFDEAGWRAITLSPTRAPAGRVCAVIPCFNVAAVCGPVISAAARFVDRVVAVDDGSTDGTAAVLATLARELAPRVEVLTLQPNHGKGAALLVGMWHALACADTDVLVTLDADGQHRALDIPALVDACRNGGQFIVGQRQGGGDAPLRSRAGNAATRYALGALLPGCPADTQSGFRAFDRRFIEAVLPHIVPGRYETEIEMLVLALKFRCRVVTVPIPRIYLDGNRGSHFRPVADSLRIYHRLLSTLLSHRAEVDASIHPWSLTWSSGADPQHHGAIRNG
jgi:N-acetyl-1-D-myo-inositol-2-amino-2-deoxy-alpha-D-glucopyranoside deacetylase